jgi:hypothetical protein
VLKLGAAPRRLWDERVLASGSMIERRNPNRRLAGGESPQCSLPVDRTAELAHHAADVFHNFRMVGQPHASLLLPCF